MLERLLEVLLAEGKLADSPDLGVGLQRLLDIGRESTGLQGDDLRSGIGIVGDGGATLRAEDAVDGVAGATLTSPALGGAVEGQLILGDNSDES